MIRGQGPGARGQVVPYDRLLLKQIRRAAVREARLLYYITGGFVYLNQDPEVRRLWEEGLVEL